MKRFIIAVWLPVCFAAATHAADLAPECPQPQRPLIPDGSSTSREALLGARTALEAYLVRADEFLTCLRAFEKRLGEAITEVDGHEVVMRYNAMVEEMYLAGDEFNIALRRFKDQ